MIQRIFLMSFCMMCVVLSLHSQEAPLTVDPDSFQKADKLFKQIEGFISEGNYLDVITTAEQVSSTCRNMNSWKYYLVAQNFIGEAYFKLSENEKALEVLFYALEEVEPYLPDNHIDIAKSFNNIASSLIALGQYEKGILYMNKSLAISEQQEEQPLLMMSALNHNLGSIQIMLEAYEEAIPYLQKALNIRKQFPINASLKIDETYNNLAHCYLFLDQPEKALDNFKRALQIREQILGTQHPKIGLAHNNIAKVQEDLKNMSLANSHYRQALDILLPSLGKDHPYVALIKSNFGANYIRQGQFQTGLAYIHWAFAPNEAFKADSLLYRNPPFMEVKHLVEKSAQYLDLLAQKANHYQAFGRKNSSSEAITFALQTYLLAAQVVDTFRMGFSDADKRILANNTLPIYEGGIHAAYELFLQTASAEYLKIAFELAEKSKSILLLEGLQAENARLFAGIPQDLRSQEQALRQSLFEAKEQFRQEQSAGSEASSSDVHDQIILLRTRYDSLLKEIEQLYPAYYDLKYDISPLALDEVQEQLAPTSLLLEYFMGEEHVFAFLISSDSISFIKLPVAPTLTSEITELRQALNVDDPFHLTTTESQGAAEQRFLNYQEASSQLYQQLIGQHHPNLSSFDHLLIIPDGTISFVPFSALITVPNPDKKADFRTCAYLLNQHAVSYAYSATLALKETSPSSLHAQSRYGGFAPTYSTGQIAQSRSDLMDIPMARKEVQEASHIFSGKAFLGEEASKGHFLNHAHEFQILHLAMHSVYQEKEQESQLIFSQDSSVGDPILSMTELYSLRLPADLVVLSACNSGWGKIAKGEGVMSLARAFAFAGCRSQVFSLWKVDDFASSQMMLDFMASVEAGKPLNQAMQAAQLNYIRQAPSSPYAHPYFWATFDVIGQVDPIYMASSFPWTYILLIVLLLSLAYLFYRLR